MTKLEAITHSQPGMVQSVSKALSLLTCFVDQTEGLSLTELARRNEINISTALRLLRTLCLMELLKRDPESELYFPGPMLIRLARTALLQGGFAEAAKVLENLARETRETASIGIQVNDCVLTILTSPSPELLRVHATVGGRVPLELSAMGRVLLAYSGDEAEPKLRTPPQLTESTITSPTRLRNEILAIQYRHFSVLDQEVSPGVRSIAAPIMITGRHAKAAVGIEGPTSRMTEERIPQLAQMLIAAGAALKDVPVYLA